MGSKGMELAGIRLFEAAVPTPHLLGVFEPPRLAPVLPILRLRLGDDGGGLDGEISPAIAHLPGANEDSRAGRRVAISVNVELPDTAVARFRGGQAAEDGEMVDERGPGAPWSCAEHQDVRSRGGGDAELDPD